jgi:hypothetical protein
MFEALSELYVLPSVFHEHFRQLIDVGKNLTTGLLLKPPSLCIHNSNMKSLYFSWFQDYIGLSVCSDKENQNITKNVFSLSDLNYSLKKYQ